jgi:drug/metabolite transporter (DMT)-like permease
MKVLLEEVPPFSTRVLSAAVGITLLAAIAARRGESLSVPSGLWPRLVLASLLNVTAWMGLASFSLLWLAAGEATIVCYTMPVWATIFAWLVLGERLTLARFLALGLGITGLGVLLLGEGLEIGLGKLPGASFALTAAILFSLGTVVTKRWPIPMPPAALVVWQTSLGCLPLLVGALVMDRIAWSEVSARSWLLLLYGGIGPLGLCYFAWFAALKRLPASAAAAGTLLTPVVGVLAAGAFLGEPLGVREVAALGLTITGVVLAIRG